MTITATASTIYQSFSIRRFQMPVYLNKDGSYYSEMKFDSKEDAIEHLKSCADKYFESSDELEEAYKDIENYGQLTIDAVTARINY